MGLADDFLAHSRREQLRRSGSMDPVGTAYSASEDKDNPLTEDRRLFPYFPTEDEFKADFRSAPLDRGQRRALKGAHTQLRRGVPRLPPEYQAEFRGMVREKEEDAGFIQDTFDVLNASSYGSAAFAKELIRTGDVAGALKQATGEWAASFGVGNADLKRASYTDILRESEWFEGETAQRLGAPALGLLLDIALDPLTWVTLGGSAAFKAGVKGASKSQALNNARRLGLLAVNPVIGAGAEAMAAGRRAGGTAVLAGRVAEADIPFISAGAQSFGQKLLPNYELMAEAGRLSRGAGGDKSIIEEANRIVDLKRERYVEEQTKIAGVKKLAGEIHATMTPTERTFVTMFWQEGPDKLRAALKNYSESIGQELSDDALNQVVAKADNFTKEFGKWYEEETGLGLLSKQQLDDYYMPQRPPQSRESMKLWERFLENNSKWFDNFLQDSGGAPLKASMRRRSLDIEQRQIFQHAREYDNVIARLMAAEPTELDFAKVVARRGIENARATSTRNFLNSVATDGGIVRKVDPTDVKSLNPDAIRRAQQLGYEYWDPTRLRKVDPKVDTRAWDELVKEDGAGVWLMPSFMGEELHTAHRLMNDTEVSKQFWKSFDTMQGIWKSYALLSPSYHIRNFYSNLFQNFIAGVRNPQRYAEAMAVQARGTENLPWGVRHAVETLIGGPRALDDVLVTTKGGKSLTVGDIAGRVEKSGVKGHGMSMMDLPMDQDAMIMSSLEGSSKQFFSKTVMIRPAEELSKQFEAAGLSKQEADDVAMMASEASHSWAFNHGKRPEAYLHEKLAGVRSGTVDDFAKDGSLYMRRKAPAEPHPWSDRQGLPFDPMPHEPNIRHGAVEMALSGAFAEGKIPSALDLRRSFTEFFKSDMGAGFMAATKAKSPDELWEKIYPRYEDMVDPREIIGHVEFALKHGKDQLGWYKDYAKGASRIVGNENMVEFSGVFSLLSSQKQPELNLAETLYVMRRMRELTPEQRLAMSEDQIARHIKATDENPLHVVSGSKAASERGVAKSYNVDKEGTTESHILYDNPRKMWATSAHLKSVAKFYKDGTMSGDMKMNMFNTNLLWAMDSKFFPMGVVDGNIATLFNWKGTPGKETMGLKYRYAQYIMAQTADVMGMSTDDVMSALWWTKKAKMDGASPAQRLGEYGEDWPFLKSAGEELSPQSYRLGSWGSAKLHAAEEISKLEGMRSNVASHGLRTGKASEEIGLEPLIPNNMVTTQHTVYDIEGTLDDLNRLRSEGARGIEVVLDGGALNGMSEAELRNFVTEFDNRLLTDFGELKGLKELEQKYNFQHAARVGTEFINGGWKPTVSIAIKGSEHAADLVAGVTGQVFRAEGVDVYRARNFYRTWDEGEEGAGLLDTLGNPTKEEIADMRASGELMDGLFISPKEGQELSQEYYDRVASAFQPRKATRREVDEMQKKVDGLRRELGEEVEDEQARGILETSISQLEDSIEAKAWWSPVNISMQGGTLRIVNRGMDNEDFLGRLSSEDLSEADVFRFDTTGVTYGRDEFTRAAQKGRVEGASTTTPDIQGRLNSQLFEPAQQLFDKFGIGTRRADGISFYQTRGGVKSEFKGKVSRDQRERNPVELTDSNKVAATFTDKRFGWVKGQRVLDLGGGRGDKAVEHMSKTHGVKLSVMDIQRAKTDNMRVRAKFLKKPADVTTINNVFSVIEDRGIRTDLLEDAARYTRSDGEIRILINEGDRSGTATRSGKGIWRANRKTQDYVQEVEEVFGSDAISYVGNRYIVVNNSRGVGGMTKSQTGEVLGAARVADDGRIQIGIFESADVSTAIHEFAHFLSLSNNLTNKNKIVSSLNLGELSDVDIEEGVARAFEDYVRSGRAPSPELLGPFGRMRDQMEAIYEGTARENINPAIQAEFDRIFRPKAAIDLAGSFTETATSFHNSKTRQLKRLQKALGRGGKMMQLHYAMGGAMENNARIAHNIQKTIDNHTAGASLDEAFTVADRSVMKYLFDYNELTPFEKKGLRRVFPFYTWMRKNVPLQFTAMFEDPTRYAGVGKFMQSVEATSPEWEDMPEKDYFADIHAVRLPLLHKEQPVYLDTKLPFQDINNLNAREILGSMTPFIKMLSETFPSTPQSLWMDRPVERYPGERGEVLSFLPKKWEATVESLVPPYSKAVRSLVKPFIGDEKEQEKKEGKFLTSALSEALGIKLIPVDEQQVLRGDAFMKAELLRNYKKKLKDDGVILPEAVRIRAGEVSMPRGRRKRRRRRRTRRGRE